MSGVTLGSDGGLCHPSHSPQMANMCSSFTCHTNPNWRTESTVWSVWPLLLYGHCCMCCIFFFAQHCTLTNVAQLLSRVCGCCFVLRPSSVVLVKLLCFMQIVKPATESEPDSRRTDAVPTAALGSKSPSPKENVQDSPAAPVQASPQVWCQTFFHPLACTQYSCSTDTIQVAHTHNVYYTT